jgi:hypothetical protein
MTTKAIDKPAKSTRTAASPRPSGAKVTSARDQTATTTTTRKREASPEQQTAKGGVPKHAQLVQLLSRPEGASIEDMMRATDWQQHSVRGFLAGTVKKKMGLVLTSSKAEGEGRRYRISTRRGR